VPALLASLLGGCSTVVVDDDPGTGSPQTPSDQLALELVEGPAVLLGDDGEQYQGARVVGRRGGFDLVSGSDTGVVARRIELAYAPALADVRQRPPAPLVEESGHGLELVVAHDDELALCTRHWNGHSMVRHYAGMTPYAETSAITIGGWNDFSCNGLAWHGGRGLISWRLCPADGGLCYAVVQELNTDGQPMGEPTTALGDGELWVAGMSAYGQGIAWAGGTPLQVWLSTAPEAATRVDIGGADPSDLTPRLAAWPFRSDAAAVVWSEARLAVVSSAEGLLFHQVLIDPGEVPTRPAVASSPLGLVTAHAACREEVDDEGAAEGSLVVTLWGSDGEPNGAAVRLPSHCRTEAASVAIVDDHVLVLWPGDGAGYQGALLRIAPR
jgi:hypothetical protein